MGYSYYCNFCGGGLDESQQALAYDLDGREVYIHDDRSRCKYEISVQAEPEMYFPNVSLRLVGVREDEPRMTGALDPERGWYR